MSPSSINYCANIDCLKQVGVTDLISLSAVGSLKDNLKPGTFVIVDQFIDRMFDGKKFFYKGIVAQTYKMNLSKNICENIKINYSFGGTYLAMEGPQFSTYAESNLYIDISNMPEAKLKRKLELFYMV